VSRAGKKSSAVTAPAVSVAILSATSREGQPPSSQSCVTRPLEMPILRAKSERLIPLDLRYSPSFIPDGFRPPKILEQVKILEFVDRQALSSSQNLSMAKTQQKRRATVPDEVERRPLHRTFIKEWRKKKGWNQTELAQAIGVSTATISQIENKETGYKQWHLEAIAEALGCEPVDLLIRSPNDPAPFWQQWDAAPPALRQQMLTIFESLLKSLHH
jgi:transcriptional regulator with XRE-family HTH domain